jgi:undecaprenyl-diphosphatase
MYLASDKLFWLPLYVLLCCFIVKSFRQKSWQILLVIAILIITSDQLSSHLIKNSVMRLRPSHVTALIPLIHLSKAGPGGLYGFVSSHAANASALAVFLSFLFDKSLIALKYVLTGWALLVSYSRIYNGVHYPADVVVALFIGSLLGILFYFIYHLILLKPFRDAV